MSRRGDGGTFFRFCEINGRRDWTPPCDHEIHDCHDDEESDDSHDSPYSRLYAKRSTEARKSGEPSPVKVALLHYSVPPIVGGVESIVAAQARVLTAAGCQVKTIARRGGADVILGAADLKKSLRAGVRGCDVVIVHNVLGMPFDLALTDMLWELAGDMPQIHWVAWVHDLAACNPDYDYAWHQAPWSRLTKASPNFSYVAVSEHRARQFSTLTGSEARVIPNGVDPIAVLGLTSGVAKLVETHRLLSREIVLFHPTRLLRRKNVEYGLQVLAELRKRGRDAVALITAAADPHQARSQDYHAALLQTRERLGLQDTAIFIGDYFAVADADVASLYQVADALFFPSRQEGFGLPIVEAAIHRLPIFCTDVQPMNSLLSHGLYVFDPDSEPGETARLVERMLDRTPAQRARREALRRYAWPVVWQEHLAPLLRLPSAPSPLSSLAKAPLPDSIKTNR